MDRNHVLCVVYCFLFNFLPFRGWGRTGQFLCQAPWLLSPAPARQEGRRDYSRCRWLCSKVHISCKKAQLGMLKTSWKSRLMFALCSGVLHKVSSLEPVLQTEVRRSSAMRAANPAGFFKEGAAGDAVSRTPCKTCM